MTRTNIVALICWWVYFSRCQIQNIGQNNDKSVRFRSWHHTKGLIVTLICNQYTYVIYQNYVHSITYWILQTIVKWCYVIRNQEPKCYVIRNQEPNMYPPKCCAIVTWRKSEWISFGNSDSPQRRLSSRLEPSSREFRLAVKLGVVSVYVFDSKHFTRNICFLTIEISTQIPMLNVRYI